MKNIRKSIPRLAGLLILSLWSLPTLFAQQSQAADKGCFPASQGGIVPTQAFFNYGNSNKMKNSTRRMRLTIGQTVVGYAAGNNFNSLFGFWSGLNVAPLPPVVTATQGELLDRIQISWSPNPLGSFPTNGFKIYRDGVFLAAVDKNTRNYNDFNIIAGKNYTYEVRAINLYGEGSAGEALGFQVPNGVVTGWVRTLNGNPVPGAQVTLSPMQGYSAKFNQFDGAVTRAGAGNHFLPTSANTDWTMTFWMKTTALTQPVVDVFRLSNNNMALRTSNAFFVADLPGASLGAGYPGSLPTDWLHVALTFSGGQYRLYLNGELKDLKSGTAITDSPELVFGANTPFPGWVGGLDELRIYHRRLDELELQETMTGTASSLTPALKYYWKMDEGAGSKSFDILNRHPLFFCGAIFDSNRPAVATSGVTNDDGYYRIEGANYGTGTTFLATPKKDFYKHRALKFLKNEGDYATLPDFSLTEKATIEVWANESETNNDGVLLQKAWGPGGSNFFVLQNYLGTIRVIVNGDIFDFGPLGIGYQHLALTIDRSPTATAISVYKNGTLLGSHNFPATTGDWSEPGYLWNVGALSGLYGVPAGQFGFFFGGLIDEVAVYDTTLSQAKIQEHAQNERDPQEKGLRIYFPLDEGSGFKLSNAGSQLVDGFGQLPTPTGTPEWTTLAKFQQTTPHEFAPATRQVTLNPSVTSVDQVDFIDRSTVAVSGFIRYANTDCFANQFEVLVNGESYKPIVLTDSTGKFIIDLEPGVSVTLRPVYKDHEFMPEEIELNNVVAPIAGLVFNDLTTRTVSGLVAGGDCKKSIISNPGTPTGTVCIVKVRTTDGCFEKQVTLDNPEGEYELADLPPLEFTVAVTEHSDPLVKTAFQVQGGVQVDLTEKQDTVVDFTYYAPPEVEVVSGLDPFSPTCDIIRLEQGELRTIGIKVKETYYNNEVCYLDTAALQIINGFADTVINTTLSQGIRNYKFKVGQPNPTPPHEKTLQIIATNLEGNESSFITQGVVTGIRNKHSTFTSKTPQTPLLVLHDPPGDGSYSFLEKDQTVCKRTTMDFEFETGGGFGLDVWLGPEITLSFGLGLELESTTGVILSGGFEGQATYHKIDSKTFETCTTFSERVSTGDNQLIVGDQGGDVFVGQAMNFEFGFADRVFVDDSTCTAGTKTVLNVEPDSFQTMFYYSEWGIRNNVIRYLDSLRTNPATPPADTLTYANSIKQWEKILKDNQKYKDSIAIYTQNISFDAGATYEYAVTSTVDTTTSSGSGVNSEGEVYTTLGYQFNAVGLQGTAKFIYSTSKTTTNGTSEAVSTKTGYVLADDDILDAFTLDVGIDKRYGTPIFNTVAGQSSCPWEPKTAHREGNTMEFRDGSGPDAIDVPSNEPAVFLFNLGNQSETNETWTYALTAGPESNPHGAKISVNGAPLDQPLFYAVPWGTSIPITVTVERGPVEYDYDSLEVVFYSLCEDIRANALGILPDADSILYSAQYLSVHFIKPCSEVDITVPEQNWVIFPGAVNGGNNILRITASGYDKSNTDFERIRVQYRRSDGDGAWINIPGPAVGGNPDQNPDGSILRDNLGNVFTQFYWDTEGLGDGDYEIRAVSVCSGDVADRPGYSDIIKGRIQRQPPSLIGTPEPSDGVYNVGDEISFSFNKDVNCNKINALDNVLLFDATTGLPIDIDITCHENKIFLNPNFQNEFFENRILRAELHDIEDLTGNALVYEQWEFYVDRNELAWLTDSIGTVKYDDESKVLTANIHNRGGYPVPFSIQSVPAWVRVVPDVGTLVPNEVREIRFEIDSLLGIGHWTDSIVLHTETGQNPFFMGGDEGLPIGVRVLCRPPQWQVNTGLYPNTMNFAVQLDIEGTLSADGEDMVAAYIDNELRGAAKVQYVPQFNTWMAFLTVYGEPDDADAPIDLEIWDASACLRYGDIVEQYVFQPDNLVGSANNPVVLHTSGQVLREIPLAQGWNWISLNLEIANPAINPVLSTLKYPEDDYIKSQAQFSEYFSGAWFGSLATLGNLSMYQYRANQPDTLKLIGQLLDPATTPIPLVQGWNWISYLPNKSLPVNDALGSLNPATGDLVKGQFGFAQFVNGFGWVGNLTHLRPPQGYQLRMSNAGTLTYPANNFKTEQSAESRDGQTNKLSNQQITSYWQVDPAQYEHSMTLIGMFNANGENATSAGQELGAFVGGELRGSAQAIFIEPLQAHLFFLTTYANQSGEQVSFKLYNSSDGQVSNLHETMWFAADLHQGSIETPVPFTLQSTGTADLNPDLYLQVQPNPFREEATVWFSRPNTEEVTLSVTDAQGRTMLQQQITAAQGMNAFTWRAGASVAAGVYFVRLETADGVAVRKVVRE